MGEPNLALALRRIQQRFRCKLTAATLGEAGVLTWNGVELQSCAAYRVPVTDTTGAGDIFHAGFIFGLLQGWPLHRQLEFACASAALNCTAVGARGRIETVSVIEDLMANGTRYEVERVAFAQV
jgi:sugar/nucleoside kinase (ribokinase family)